MDDAKVMGSLFESNTAHDNISELIEVSNIATAALESLLQQDINVEGLQYSGNQPATLAAFGLPCAQGCGGAAFIDLTGGAANVVMADVKIASSNFSANVAELGGRIGQFNQCKTNSDFVRATVSQPEGILKGCHISFSMLYMSE